MVYWRSNHQRPYLLYAYKNSIAIIGIKKINPIVAADAWDCPCKDSAIFSGSGIK
ncbi:MAG: hypothetical protein GWM89_09140 [Candidatus Dadabacteria bacterium]|nr:hypothetical protein [Candidatus Dadabacteria bacterium]NIX15841.1 hypothetical protein [Candidatus Dadabacteria bacterium]NIY22566.1 hypothetical protein [Candidatus Dadabacteria bacterium]